MDSVDVEEKGIILYGAGTQNLRMAFQPRQTILW